MNVLPTARISGDLAGSTCSMTNGVSGPGENAEQAGGTGSRRLHRRLVIVIVALLASVVPATRAAAATNGVQVGVFPEFPTRVELHAANVAASVNVINGSVGAEATGPLTVTELTLVPACGNFTPTCASAADPGVFALSAKGTGGAGTNCVGKSFDITVVDTVTGRVRFTPSDGSAFLLGQTDITTELDTCRINFTMTSLKVPVIDSYPSLGEPQTNQVGFLSVRHGNGSTATDQGEDVTTLVVPTTPPTTTPPTTVPPTTTTTKPPTTTTTVPPTTTTTTVPVPAAKYARWLDRAFRDLLGRAPNAAESSYWVGQLSGGQQTRASLSRLITASTEYRRYMVGKYFTAYLGRAATDADLSYYTEVLLPGGWTFEFCEGWLLGGDEFYARQGSTLVDFAEALYRLVLGVTPDPGGVAYVADQLAKGVSRFSMAVAFTTYPGTHDRVAAAAAPWLLRRAATPAEVTAWSSQLDGGLRVEYFYANIVASSEYWSQV